MSWLSVIFGAIVGFSLGLTGGGGAIFAMPLLVYGLGVVPRTVMSPAMSACVHHQVVIVGGGSAGISVAARLTKGWFNKLVVASLMEPSTPSLSTRDLKRQHR